MILINLEKWMYWVNKYFIDTSVWIDYFKHKGEKINNTIDKLIDENAIYINGIVKTEILFGANDNNEYEYLNNCLDGLIFLEIDRNLFKKIAYNGYLLKKSGLIIPLSDLIIATQCHDFDLILIDRDKHFNLLKSIIKIKRFNE